jgi:hypothetical protein
MTGKGMKKRCRLRSPCPDFPVPIPLPNIPLPNIPCRTFPAAHSLPHIRFPRWTEEETVSRSDAEPPRNPSASLREFQSFPAPKDEHFYTVCRYVERNALRANLAPGCEAIQRDRSNPLTCSSNSATVAEEGARE